MAELDKVIKGIECHRSGICDNDKTLCPYWDEESDCSKKMLADTLELLKKQKPMKVIDRNVSMGYAICPSCKKMVIHQQIDFSITNYCGRCGQAVKWE